MFSRLARPTQRVPKRAFAPVAARSLASLSVRSAAVTNASKNLSPFKPSVATRFTSTRGSPHTPVSIPPSLAKINSKVLDDEKLSKLIGPELWATFVKCRENGTRLEKKDANELAHAIREWAQVQGCIGYSHWFSPVRGPIHGEKIETFVALDFSSGNMIIDLTGSELFSTETDGSSFPNGGLRVTHAAAAFMGWDTRSPPFVYGDVLYIPSSFVSWTGDALDYKTPLLRSNAAVSAQSVRLLRHLGDKNTRWVDANVGWEQEFFIVDRPSYLERPDLVATGRTLFGQTPLRGQEQSGNYFAKMPVRVRDYLTECRERMWELGISIDCLHNEVAPAQHEISPIFSLTNLAADTNVLAMELMQDIAYKHDLAVLFHEKPFRGINGSGKHNNWGLNCEDGTNLFVAGETDAEQLRFMAFSAALTRALHLHGDLLRIGVSSAGNDHRLGAQEAPPAIITLFMGNILHKHILDAVNGGSLTGYKGGSKMIEVATSVPPIKAGLEDRNRTAPFPFCGNRFEFRAVGGNQQIAFPLAMVNTAMAEGLSHLCDRMDNGESVEDAIRNTFKEHQAALFAGNNYDPYLIQYANDNGLFHLKTTPEAYQQLASKKNVELFDTLKVFKPHETEAQQNILYEAFVNNLSIEARTMLNMLKTAIIPACLKDVSSDSAAAKDTGLTSEFFNTKRSVLQALLTETDALTNIFAKIESIESLDQQAFYCNDVLKPQMEKTREAADELEGLVDKGVWPYPSYDDLTHEIH